MPGFVVVGLGVVGLGVVGLGVVGLGVVGLGVVGLGVVGLGVVGLGVVGLGVVGLGVVGLGVVGLGVVGLGVVGLGVVGLGVVGFVALTDSVSPEGVPVGGTVPSIGLDRTGDRTERADGDAPDRGLVAEAEDGCAGADADGVGPVHGLDITYKLSVAGLPEPVREVGLVAVGVGLADRVGAHFVGFVVGVMLGALFGVTDGTGATMPGVAGFALGTVVAGFTHVDVGDGRAVNFPVPRGPEGTPAAPGTGWPEPLLLAPPFPRCRPYRRRFRRPYRRRFRRPYRRRFRRPYRRRFRRPYRRRFRRPYRRPYRCRRTRTRRCSRSHSGRPGRRGLSRRTGRRRRRPRRAAARPCRPAGMWPAVRRRPQPRRAAP